MKLLSLPAIKYRKKCQLLAFFCLITIATIFLRGWQLGLVHSVDMDRIRYHAIPVAISFLYHNQPHDYTAIKEIAFPFQAADPTQQLIDEAVHKEITQRDTYYWAADDKGFGDFVIIAFKLFGPQLSSLYLLWFVCLTFSVGLFITSFRRSLASLALLGMTLVGILATISALPLADEANFVKQLPGGLFSTVSLYEPRFSEVLAMIPVIHLCLFALRRTWPPNGFQVAGLLGQVVFFFFLYHARSSLGWQIVAVGIVAALLVAARLYRRKQSSSGKAVQIASPAWVLVLLVVGLVSLSLYQRATYNPRYFEDMGVRTVWHNALIGIGFDPMLTEKYGVRVGDLATAQAVINFARRGECAAGVDKSVPQEWLDTLGGHGEKDWYAYESCAKKLYFHIWKNDPLRMLRLYLVTKPIISLQVVSHAVKETGDPLADATRDRLNIGWYPFKGITFALAIVVLAIAPAALYRRRKQLLALLAILFVTSLIPSVSFYAAILTMGGTFIILTVLCYLFLQLGVRRFGDWLYKGTAR